MLWAALLPSPSADPSRRIESLQGLAVWCLGFTPSVALVEPDHALPTVVMELESSVRLFGGRRLLAERVKLEAAELGAQQLAWAPNSLAAVALARAGKSDGIRLSLQAALDPLPLDVLSPVAAHAEALTTIGCDTLGKVRALPRGGLARRFDKALLTAMDQAYGLVPEAHRWVTLPDSFTARLELMARVELAPALLFGARRLLLQLCAWLAARHCGVTAFALKWWHDAMRAKTTGDGGELVIRTAHPTRDIEHLSRLLAEHLAKVELLAGVGDLELRALDVQPLEEASFTLFPEPVQAGESLALLLERIAARLGPECVQRPVVKEDHRIEWVDHWQPAPAPRPRKLARCVDVPQPTFLLPKPLPLTTRGPLPYYLGPLELLIGPHRVEGGWWDRAVQGEGDDRETVHRNVARDYWVAVNRHAGLLWIFQTRLANDETRWFLQGVFA
jgi:protein ImuB